MRSESEIVAQLTQLRIEGKLAPDEKYLKGSNEPLTKAELSEAENRLGRELPALLKEIYSKVANGGFGCSYGFLGLIGGPKSEDDCDALELWASFCEEDEDDEYWQWPQHLLPIGHLGCAMYHCFDLSTPDGALLLFEPNAHEDEEPWDDALFRVCPSLNAYLNAWLDGHDIFERFPPQLNV